MKIRIYQTDFDEGLKGEYNIPNTSGTYYCTATGLMGQSDRVGAFPVTDPRAWAYGVWMDVRFRVQLNVNQATNVISVVIDSFDSWTVKREDTRQTSGYRCYQGNYSYYSTINGNLIHQYIGPYYSGQGDASWSGSGGTATINVGNVNPENESTRYQFARFYNNVNGNQAFDYIAVYNDLPQDYRPGERNIGGTWKSLNRAGGVCERNNSWYEMRTVGGAGGATGDPPERKIGNTWTNMSRIGAE